jgi:hypothetical protein
MKFRVLLFCIVELATAAVIRPGGVVTEQKAVEILEASSHILPRNSMFP